MSFLLDLIKVNPFTTRKEIFSQYKLPEDPVKSQERVQVSKDKRNSNEILIRQLGLFKFNISAVLSQKESLLNKFSEFNKKINAVYSFIAFYNEGQVDNSPQIARKFQVIQNMQSDSQIMQNIRSTLQKSLPQKKGDEEQYLVKSLIIYKELLRQGQSIKYEAQCFRLGTLSNLNPKHTKAKFTKSPYGAQMAIKQYIDQIIVSSSNAKQSEVRFISKCEKDRFLLEEDKYDHCWKKLQELYNPKRVQNIHFQMLNVLEMFDEEFNRFLELLDSHKLNFKKYQGVNDSMELMKRQIKQMAEIIQSRDRIIGNLESMSPEQQQSLRSTLQKCQQEQPIIEKNIKIYHVNKKIFAFYNTETNLRSYSIKRNEYSDKLDALETRMQNWQFQYEVIQEISHNYCQIEDIINKKSVQNNQNRIFTKGNNTDSNLQNLIIRIQEINVKKNNKLSNFKRTVLLNIGQRMSVNNLGTQVILPDSKKNLNSQFDQQILQNQQSMIQRINRANPNQRKELILENFRKIQQFVDYNQKKLKTPIDRQFKLQLQRYDWSLRACRYIGIVTGLLLRIDGIQTYVHSRQGPIPTQFKKIIDWHLDYMKGLMDSKYLCKSAQIDGLFYNHVYDYSLFKKLFSDSVWNEFINSLKIYEESQKKSDLKQVLELSVFIRLCIKEKYHLLTKNLLQIFSKTLFMTANEISPELFIFEDEIWKLISQAIIRNSVISQYQPTNIKLDESNKSSKIIPMDPSIFFTFPILYYLSKNNNSSKVKKLDQTLIKIIKNIYNSFNNYKQHELLQNAALLTLLIKYIKKNYEQEEYQVYLKEIIKLRHLITAQILQAQFIKAYQVQLNDQENKSLIGSMAVQLHRFTYFKAQPERKQSQKSPFQVESNKYLKSLQHDIKPLEITLSPSISSTISLSTIQQLQRFQKWIGQLSLQLKNQISTNQFFFVSYIFTQRYYLYKLLDKSIFNNNQMRQSEGFMIRAVRKQNFYLKRQINKFKLIEKQNVWNQYEKLLSDLIEQFQRNRKIQKMLVNKVEDDVQNMERKVKRILLQAQKKFG